MRANTTTDQHAHYAAKSIIAEAGSVQPQELTSLHVVKAFANESRHSQGVRYSRSIAYRRIMRHLAEEHGAPSLARAVPRVRVPAPRAVTVTAEERRTLIGAATDPALRCWLLLCSDLGMRAKSAATICPANYDAGTGTITFVGKFGSAQTLPVTGALADLFARAEANDVARQTKRRRWLGNVETVTPETSTPYVALLSRLGRIDYGTLQHKFAKLRRSVGITRQITAHDLRRTTAVKLYSLTKDLRAVQALLGHRTLATTLYYLDHRNTPVDLAKLELAKLNPITERPQ